MKQNPCPTVGEVSKPACIGLDKLDGTVEAFNTGVADFALAAVEQPVLVSPEHLDDLFHRLQIAAHRVVRPGFEQPVGSTFVAVAPSVRRSIPRPTALTMMALTVLQDSRVSVQTACVVGQASNSLMTNAAIMAVTRL